MKEYQGEKAIISLTSWKARINTVGLTIFSLLTSCPGFHVVLVLSEEEFPKKEAELPRDLRLLSRMNRIEILWVYKNYKSLKKVLFTMDKYRDVPVISADDDLIYIYNYANDLYQLWLSNKKSICTMNAPEKYTNGQSTLYYPLCFGDDVVNDLKKNQHVDIYSNADDGYYEVLRAKYKSSVVYSTARQIYVEQNADKPLRDIYWNHEYMVKLRAVQCADNNGVDIGLEVNV